MYYRLVEAFSETFPKALPEGGKVQAITNAIIYLPAHAEPDSIFARLCLAHIERHGYHLISIVREWGAALGMIRSRSASVIVFARPEHFEPDFEPRVEFVGEETTDLVRLGTTRPRNERHSEGDSRSRRPRPTN